MTVMTTTRSEYMYNKIYDRILENLAKVRNINMREMHSHGSDTKIGLK